MALLKTLDDKIRISIDENQTMIVGRIDKCDVVLEDGSISSQHARLHLENHILHLKDLDSTNGTRVNYALVDKPTVLLDGDTVEFGNVTFTVDAPELCAPHEDASDEVPEALTSLEPIEEPLDLAATMQLSDIQRSDLDDHRPKPLERVYPKEKEASPEPTSPSLDHSETTVGNPVLTSFAVALGLLIVGLGLLLLFVDRISSSL